MLGEHCRPRWSERKYGLRVDEWRQYHWYELNAYLEHLKQQPRGYDRLYGDSDRCQWCNRKQQCHSYNNKQCPRDQQCDGHTEHSLQ